LRQETEKDEKLSKQQDKRDKVEQICHLKQKKLRDSDKVEQTFVIKSKYRKVTADEEEERVSNEEDSVKNVNDKHSKQQDKRDSKESRNLKEQKRRTAKEDTDKVEHTFIVKSKYRKVADVDDDEQDDEDRVSEKEHSTKKDTRQSIKSRKNST